MSHPVKPPTKSPPATFIKAGVPAFILVALVVVLGSALLGCALALFLIDWVWSGKK